MRLTASSFYGLYRPSPCALRVFLKAKGVEEGKPSPYEEVIIDLGRRYEIEHVGSLKNVLDLSGGSEEERTQRTKEAVQRGVEVIYHPLFVLDATIRERKVTLVGEPDLLVKVDGGYNVRDVKLSRRITEKDHPEILLQLGMYGWLYEQALKSKPKRLEVLAGTRKLEEVPATFVERAQAEVQRIVDLRLSSDAPFSPVGWTKCGGCVFNAHCWTAAVERKNVATVPGVDQGLALALRDRNVQTIDELLEQFDVQALSEVQKPWGNKTQKVGKAADRIIRSAKAIASGKEEVLQQPDVPSADNYVVFDLEGLPPQIDELDKVYLWGVQVYGKKPSDYFGKIAAIGDDGDRVGWDGFLDATRTIFETYGDLPFVHWSHYEKTKITQYIERFGDRDGLAERVKKNLLDLLPRTQAAVALPLPSYSLKVIEKHVGFERTQEEFGGDWSMATFIKATETKDEATRQKLLKEILTYNKEDLSATWVVLEWLRARKVN